MVIGNNGNCTVYDFENWDILKPLKNLNQMISMNL